MNSTDQTIVGAYPPPQGVVPNFTNPESIASRVLLAAVLCPVFTIPIVVLRLYTSRVILRCWHLDDLCISISLMFAIGYSITNVLQMNNGVGIHIWNVPLTTFVRFMKLGALAGALTYNLSTLFTKVSILHFYLRFSRAQGNGFKIATYFTMFVAVGYSLAAAFAFTYMCRPIPRYWDWGSPGTCLNVGRAFISSAVLNAFTDLIILCLPMWLLRSLRMRLLQKIGVALVLMAGGFVCAVSIVRLASIPSGLHDMDITWRYVVNLNWCIIEMYAGIVCACLPCLRAFFKHHFPNLFAAKPPSDARLATLPSFVRQSRQQVEPSASIDRRPWWGRTLLSRSEPSETSSMEACNPTGVPPEDGAVHFPEKTFTHDRYNGEGSV